VHLLAVLDFRRNSNVPNYLGSKEQRRWLLLLALAGIIAILVFRSGAVAPRWFAPAALDDGLDTESAARDDQGPRAGRGAPGEGNAFFPGVRADYLSEVRDDEVFRAAERDAWFHLLALLENTDERELERASLGRVGYLQLDQQPASYRGRLVTVSGVVRSARLVDAPDNDFGVERYYQLWLQPERSAPELIVLYVRHLPAEFPLGTQLEAPCTATGFFFKRWAYQSQQGVTTAPLILARTLNWAPPQAPPPEAPLGEQMVLAVAVALALAVLVVGYFVARSRAGVRPRRGTDVRDLQTTLAARANDSAERHGAGSGHDAAED
jgi:hypothetical protein